MRKTYYFQKVADTLKMQVAREENAVWKSYKSRCEINDCKPKSMTRQFLFRNEGNR